MVTPLTVEGTQAFFKIATWPEELGQIDLGERVIDVIPIPGHDKLSIALYDRQTGILFTGDSLYPGGSDLVGATGSRRGVEVSYDSWR